MNLTGFLVGVIAGSIMTLVIIAVTSFDRSQKKYCVKTLKANRTLYDEEVISKEITESTIKGDLRNDLQNKLEYYVNLSESYDPVLMCTDYEASIEIAVPYK